MHELEGYNVLEDVASVMRTLIADAQIHYSHSANFLAKAARSVWYVRCESMEATEKDRSLATMFGIGPAEDLVVSKSLADLLDLDEELFEEIKIKQSMKAGCCG